MMLDELIEKLEDVRNDFGNIPVGVTDEKQGDKVSRRGKITEVKPYTVALTDKQVAGLRLVDKWRLEKE